jgi:hypothetical protein
MKICFNKLKLFCLEYWKTLLIRLISEFDMKCWIAHLKQFKLLNQQSFSNKDLEDLKTATYHWKRLFIVWSIIFDPIIIT